jgi:Fe(3+) dicitrate transport protein
MLNYLWQKNLLFFSCLIICCAQNGLKAQITISGKVLHANTQKPLPGVEIFHNLSKKVVVTNALGAFSVTALPTGPQELTFFTYQFNPKKVRFSLSADTSLMVTLEPLGKELSEVVIRQKREEYFRLNRLKQVEGTAIYAGKKTERVLLENTVANLGANTARQVYAQVVGLNIYENNDAGLQLNIGGRGLDPNRTSNFNVRQNGYDISADVLGYPESYYTPTAEALQEIQVVRGAASLQYGTQFGGLINFKMKNPNPDTALELISRNTLGSYGLYTHFTSLSGTKGKWGYYTFFNYREGAGWRPNSAFHARNVYAHLHYNFTPKTQLAAEYTFLNYLAKQPGGLTDSQFKRNPRFSNRSRNWFQVNWQLYAFKFSHRFSSKTNLSVNLFGLNAQRNAVGFRGNPASLNTNPITEVDEQNAEGQYLNPRDVIRGAFVNAGAEARLLHRYQIKNKNSVLLVGSKYYQAQNSALQGPGTIAGNPDFSLAQNQFPNYANQSKFDFPNRNWAVFSENIFYLSPRFTLTPGLRFEYIKTASAGSYQQVNFDNAGNVIFRDTLQDNRTFERAFVLAGLGASYQVNPSAEVYANFSQNYRSVTFSDIRTVNPTFVIDPEITDETGFTADAGLRGNWQQYLNYDFSLFSLLYNNRIGIVLNNRAQRVRKNIGSALIYGAECFVEVNWLALAGVKNKPYQLSTFFNGAFTRSQYLASEDNNVVGNAVEFIPGVNLKSGLTFGYKNLIASLQYTYLSEQFTDVESSPPAAQGDLREGMIGIIPSYQIIDLSLSYRYKRYRLEAGCNNLGNQNYFTRRATGYPGPGIIPADPRTFYFTVGVQF